MEVVIIDVTNSKYPKDELHPLSQTLTNRNDRI